MNTEQQTEIENEPLTSSEPVAEASAGESAVADGTAVVAEPPVAPKEDTCGKGLGTSRT